MQCEQFEQAIEQQDFQALPEQALAHMKTCAACGALFADFGTIRSLASEMAAEPIAPLPEHLWVSLRNQLEAEGLIHNPEAAPVRREPQTSSAWWSVFQRPALAGAILGLVLASAGALSFLSNSQSGFSQLALAPQQDSPVALSANSVFKEEVLNVSNDSIAGTQRQDAAVTNSIRRNLQIVDNFIAMCEKDVREQPDNQMAREYLYGAYEQKAELLATAMNRNVTGGLQ